MKLSKFFTKRKSQFLKISIFALLIFSVKTEFLFAAEESPEANFKYPYEYRLAAGDIKKVGAPYQKDDYLIFTQEKGPRHIGIAFDFENYKTIHSFQKKSSYDMDGKETNCLYFYILDVPRNVEKISYKLIVDGIWTTDSTNQNKFYNPYIGIEVSTLNIKNNHKNETQQAQDGIHFVYQGESGKKIRLAGTFSNWDASIYSLSETSPGFYELYLPLPKGTYYYAYYSGTKSFADKSNPNRAWSTDGRETSLIVVD